LNLQNTVGGTALMLASQKGHKELVELLLDKGANPNLKSYEGKTTYDCAENNDIKSLIGIY
jgi:ankyrin repeat protein